jgi:hypothetical protein
MIRGATNVNANGAIRPDSEKVLLPPLAVSGKDAASCPWLLGSPGRSGRSGGW